MKIYLKFQWIFRLVGSCTRRKIILNHFSSVNRVFFQHLAYLRPHIT